MKRLILAIPEGLTFDQLAPEQQYAVNSVFGQFVLPMPGTRPANGKQIVDAVAADNFDPAAIGELGLPFEILAYWQWDGSTLDTILPLDEAAWLPFLPDVPVLDEQGEQTGVMPPMFHIPHGWAGWPA